ncbi:hypothetical protein ES708_29249 [subsurface metagenome]
MSRSIDFNNTDMSAHKLIITTPGFNVLKQLVGRIQLQDRGYGFTPMREPRHITVAFAVTGTSLSDLDINLDAVKRLLTLTVPAKLIFDSLPLRYYNAILESFEGEYSLATLFQGTLGFVCPDPLGYKTVPYTDHDHAIDAAEDTIYEPVLGTGYVLPVYTLTAKENLGSAETPTTIKLKNVTTNEELIWEGFLVTDGTLVINCEKWLVSKGVDASMATVTGKFPRLKPAATNEFLVTGLFAYVEGNLNIAYKDTYQ